MKKKEKKRLDQLCAELSDMTGNAWTYEEENGGIRIHGATELLPIYTPKQAIKALEYILTGTGPTS